MTSKLTTAFAQVKDPRRDITKLHLLNDILIISILSVISIRFKRDFGIRSFYLLFYRFLYYLEAHFDGKLSRTRFFVSK